MIIAFEGIDGSGKTTLARRLVAFLREQGVPVAETRPAGAEKSRIADQIRDITRDASNARLAPVPEFLLFLARYLQQIDEMQAREEEVLVADRSFYTPVFTAAARGALAVDQALAIARTCARDLPWPDLVAVVDVDIETSRIRKRIAKIEEKRLGESRRKGTLGLGARVRLRRVCLETAKAHPDRFVVVDNTAPTPEPAFEALVKEVASWLKARNPSLAGRLKGAPPAGPAPIKPIRTPGGCPWPARWPVENVPPWFYGEMNRLAPAAPKLVALCLKGLNADQAWTLRETVLEKAPEIVAYSLSTLADDRSRALRDRLADRVPYHVLHSLPSWAAEEADIRLRRRLVEAAPFEVGLSLKGWHADWAWAIRKDLERVSLDAALVSLRGIDTDEAWRIRSLAGKKERKALLRGLAGLASEEAWRVRRKLAPKHPVEVLGSLAGVDADEALALRASFVKRAPESVMRSLAGLFDDRHMALRAQAAPESREAIGSLGGCASEPAWLLREQYVDLWPVAAVASLGPEWTTERGRLLIQKAMASAPGSLKLGRCITRYLEAAS